MGYTTTVIEVGPEAAAFLEEGMAVTFANNAPDELRPFCFLLEEAEFSGALAVGQGVLLGDQVWTITAVGSAAQQNLSALGHVTLVFDGAAEPRLPGAVHLGGIDGGPQLALASSVVFDCGE